MSVPVGDKGWDEFHDPEIVDWKRVRSAIEHENLLTNHRLTWLLTSQGFLFGAFALVFQASTNVGVMDATRSLYQYVLVGTSITGVASALHMSAGVRAAKRQHKTLEAWWDSQGHAKSNRHPQICGDDPKLLFSLGYDCFALVFLIGWVMFLLAPLQDLYHLYARTLAIGSLLLAFALGFGALGFWIRVVAERRGDNQQRTSTTPVGATDSETAEC